MEDVQEIDHKAFDAGHMRDCLQRWPHCAANGETKRCFTCAYFIPMVGVFAEEAGACTHERSPCDGRLTARQDGCDACAFGLCAEIYAHLSAA